MAAWTIRRHGMQSFLKCMTSDSNENEMQEWRMLFSFYMSGTLEIEQIGVTLFRMKSVLFENIN